jgi:hypothetical protein
MGNIPAPRRRRNYNFDLPAKRRKEIVLHACHVEALDTEDRNRWLIAWHWHNGKANDPIWSLMEAAKRMGGEITEAEASAITEEASITRKRLSADNLARFLGVTYAQRQALRLTTIGSVNVKRRARVELRKRSDRLYQECKRRASGARAQSQSLCRTQPWKELGMSRRTWYRRNKLRTGTSGTTSSAPIFLTTADRPVPTARAGGGEFERGFASKKARGLPSSQTATTTAADRYASLPLELRLAALCLPLPKNLARAA